jgi:hypothetical protein
MMMRHVDADGDTHASDLHVGNDAKLDQQVGDGIDHIQRNAVVSIGLLQDELVDRQHDQ